MELNDFAWRVLSSCELGTKLEAPSHLTDLLPSQTFDIPTQPGRPAHLALDKWKSSPKVPFPTQSELHDPRNVAKLLHFFANHELLALELMALALLRFSDAPSAFRMGVAKTMLDEQRHLQSYIGKMNEQGIKFGDLPVNDFFWSQCGGMKSPMDYVSRMSLTFEQANLDFASYFRDVLVSIGDSETAQLLQSVLDDEIGHVKHGLTWFRRWKPEEKSDWQAFCEALGGEINPSRAKGAVFSVDSRQKVGLTPDFIDSLKIYSQSKGSLPRLSFFNSDAEEQIRLGFSSPVTLAPHLLAARDDLSSVMMFVLNQDDLLLLPRELPRRFLLTLRDCGFALPEIQQARLDAQNIQANCARRRFRSVTPWAVTPWTRNLERSRVVLSDRLQTDDLPFRELYSKATALDVLKKVLGSIPLDDRLVDKEVLGVVVADPQQFEKVMETLHSSGQYRSFLAKKPWSASGRHRLAGDISPLSWAEQPPSVRRWFEKAWQRDECPIVQPLFDRVFDVSVQGRVDEDALGSKVLVHGFTRVLNMPNGQYAGTCVGRLFSGLDQNHLRFWHSQPSGGRGTIDTVLRHFALEAGQAIAEMGFRGAFGIDSFVFKKKDGQLALYPLVEINPRFTMGRVALGLEKRMAPGRMGLWLHVPFAWLAKLKTNSFVELCERWQKEMPLETYTKSGGTLILSGLLETTPAEQAERVWTCFVVGSELNEVLRRLGVEDFFAQRLEDESR